MRKKKKIFVTMILAVIILFVGVFVTVQLVYPISFSDIKVEMRPFDDFEWETFDVEVYKENDSAQLFWNKGERPSENRDDYFVAEISLNIKNNSCFGQRNFTTLLSLPEKQNAILYKIPELFNLSVEPYGEIKDTVAIFITCRKDMPLEAMETIIRESVATIYFENFFGVSDKSVPLTSASLEYV